MALLDHGGITITCVVKEIPLADSRRLLDDAPAASSEQETTILKYLKSWNVRQTNLFYESTYTTHVAIVHVVNLRVTEAYGGVMVKELTFSSFAQREDQFGI